MVRTIYFLLELFPTKLFQTPANRDLSPFELEVVLADIWLCNVPAGSTEEHLYRQWLASGCPDEEPEPIDEGIHLHTAHSMRALHYLTMDAQVRQYMDLRNLIRDPDLSPLPAHLQSSTRPFEQHLFTKLKLLMAQRELLLGRFVNLLRILSFYDDILLDIVEGLF
jgi:hypothetical protein